MQRSVSVFPAPDGPKSAVIPPGASKATSQRKPGSVRASRDVERSPAGAAPRG
jgi:hypothetical protein